MIARADKALPRPAFARTRPALARGIPAEQFDSLVRLHQQRVYRVIRALVRDHDTADTLAQECFLRAFQQRQSFRGEASVETWLLRIAVNLVLDQRKNRRRAFWQHILRRSDGQAAEAEMLSLPAPEPSPEQALLAREALAEVEQAVEHLPAQQRTVFLLRFLEEMPLEEIAQAMGLKTGTVKTHLFRAVRAVRQALERRENDARPSE